MCPVVGAPRLVCHVLLAETKDGLLLVDTGFGLGDVRDPRRLSRPFLLVVRPELREEATAIRQIEKLGFKATDVRHIAITHLDRDHAGALADFPHAEVHLMLDEHTRATSGRDRRYVRAQLPHDAKWRPHTVEGDRWMGFEAVRAIADDVFMVPLAGHSAGHAGVAVRAEDRWQLHAGDAYYFADEMNMTPKSPIGLALFQRLVQFDEKKRLSNQQRLRELIRDHGTEVTVFSAHDSTELERAL